MALSENQVRTETFLGDKLDQLRVSHSAMFTAYKLARAMNFLDYVEQEVLNAGIITDAELQCWRASLEQADPRGELFFIGTGALIAGRKA